MKITTGWLFNLRNICVHSCAIFLFMSPWDNMWGLTCLRVTVKYFTFVSPDPHIAPFLILTLFACFVSHFISVSLIYMYFVIVLLLCIMLQLFFGRINNNNNNIANTKKIPGCYFSRCYVGSCGGNIASGARAGVTGEACTYVYL